MKLYFSEEQKEKEMHKIFLEEDDLLLEGEFVEGSGRQFTITGVATIEGERYRDFEVVFELETEVGETLEDIMNADWESYGFHF